MTNNPINSALNHHLVVHRITAMDEPHCTQIFEYTWNHSMTIELWRVYEPKRSTKMPWLTTAAAVAHVEVYPHRQLVAVLDALSPDGDPATLRDVRNIVKMHAGTLHIAKRTLAHNSTNTEQY